MTIDITPLLKHYGINNAMLVRDKASDAIAYVGTDPKGRPVAAVYYGKQSKPVAFNAYRDEAQRAKRVAEWFSARQQHQAAKAERRQRGPSDIAQRNAAIKRVLEQRFGKGKVSVKGDRGTAYGWVRVHISVAGTIEQRQEWHSEVMHLMANAGIKLSHYYGDMDNEPRAEILIEFDRT